MSEQLKWINFWNAHTKRRGTEDLIDAHTLRDVLRNHDGSERYHSAFDMLDADLRVEEDTGRFDSKGKKIYRYHAQTLETLKRYPKTVANYIGVHRPAFGYVWFDFDSADGGETARLHAQECLQWLGHESVLLFFSGNKGFHIGIPLALTGLQPSANLGKTLNFVATQLKQKRWASLDTTVFNPQRKFRALGSKHPKTGLFKVRILAPYLSGLDMAAVREFAKGVGTREIPEPPESLSPHEELSTLCTQYAHSLDAGSDDAITLAEWKRYRTPNGERAFTECKFLAYCKENPAKLDEPKWYAAASVVGRFKEGRKQFHTMSRGHPNYSPEDTDAKLEQALQASGPRTCKAINAMWGECSGCVHFEKIKSPVVILEKEVIPSEATGFYNLDLSTGAIKRFPDYEGLVQAYTRDFKFFRDSKADKTYTWNGRHFEVATSIDVLAWCEQTMLPAPTQKVRNEFKAKIEANNIKPQNEIDKFFHETTMGKLNLENGILDVATGSLYPHDERVGFCYALPYAFDPSAQCPTFEKFLDDITLKREDLKQTLLEFMGYCLWPSYDDHCFLWMIGGGRNGKSTFMEMLKLLVGEANTSAVLLDFFVKSNYIEMMNHKLLNISEESDSRKLSSETVGVLKALSAGSSVQVDQKYQLPYMMKPTAKLVFASNSAPNLGGAEDALKSRMILVPFDLKLEEHGDSATSSQIDWQIIPKMKAELPGILNLVITHLRNFVLRTPRKVYRSSITHHAMNEIMRDSDHIERWVQDRITFLPNPKEGSGFTTAELYEDFKKYLGSETEYVPELNPFARRLRSKLGNKCAVTQKQIDGKRSQTYTGISLPFTREF